MFACLDARTPSVPFAWWGSEELGLLGSRHYLERLGRAQRDRIALYLNLDMVGSRSARRLVYDGNARGPPPGSRVIQQVLTRPPARPGPGRGNDQPGRWVGPRPLRRRPEAQPLTASSASLGFWPPKRVAGIRSRGHERGQDGGDDGQDEDAKPRCGPAGEVPMESPSSGVGLRCPSWPGPDM